MKNIVLQKKYKFNLNFIKKIFAKHLYRSVDVSQLWFLNLIGWSRDLLSSREDFTNLRREDRGNHQKRNFIPQTMPLPDSRQLTRESSQIDVTFYTQITNEMSLKTQSVFKLRKSSSRPSFVRSKKAESTHWPLALTFSFRLESTTICVNLCARWLYS